MILYKDMVKGLPFLPWKNYLLLCPTGGSEFPELATMTFFAINSITLPEISSQALSFITFDVNSQ
jgi:hypothetical protein